MNVIFDLGNVVLDWDTGKILRTTEFSEPKKMELNEQLFLHQDWLDLDCGYLTESALVEKVRRRSTLEYEEIANALEIAKKSLVPIPESVVLLKEFDKAGLPLYCLSNMSVETYEYLKRKSTLFDIFSGVVISAVEKLMKPDPEIFALMMARYSLEASETLFIDDNEDNIEAAKAAGLNTHHFKRTSECYASLRGLTW